MTAKQIGKRLIQIVIVVIGISFLSFLITYLAPGDPVRTMYAATGMMPDEEIIEQTREAMGLNRPVLVQYADWLWNGFAWRSGLNRCQSWYGLRNLSILLCDTSIIMCRFYHSHYSDIIEGSL